MCVYLRGEDEDVGGDHTDHTTREEVQPGPRIGFHVQHPARYDREPDEGQPEAHPVLRRAAEAAKTRAQGAGCIVRF